MEKIIIAQLNIKEDKVEQFLELAKTMVTNSRQEKSCITYRLLNEIDKPNEFVFYEKYLNQEAVDFHNSSEYLKAFLQSVPSLLSEEAKIDIY